MGRVSRKVKNMAASDLASQSITSTIIDFIMGLLPDT